MVDETDPVAARRQRYRRSILDSVVEQYRFWQSDASNLGTRSRARIADHFDRIREHEMRVFGMTTPGGDSCMLPPEPGPSTIPHGGTADPDGEGIDISLDALVSEWRLMSDIYALAIQCDVLRFGSVTFQAAGERIRLSGRYEHGGRLVYPFDDRGERGLGGSKGCSHEWWHEFNESRANTQIRAHIHLLMNEVGYFLGLLDDPEHRDENGLTILENAMVTVSTESGDGRHNDTRRELSGVFHAISGANQRFQTGDILDLGATGLDLYNTMLRAYGVTRKLGPSDRAVNEVTAILR